mgnify:CR=1 FL=1
MNELILIRGIPGSGKSEFVSSYLADQAVHIETDQFFVGVDGVYRFIPEKLKIAHAWCQVKAEVYLRRGVTVVVSNTFSQQWELQPYIDMAKFQGVKLRVLTVHGDYGSQHNVPRKSIQKMIDRWEPDPVL